MTYVPDIRELSGVCRNGLFFEVLGIESHPQPLLFFVLRHGLTKLLSCPNCALWLPSQSAQIFLNLALLPPLQLPFILAND